MKILTSIIIILLFATTSWATDLSTATLKQLVSERPDLVSNIQAGKHEGTSTVTTVKDAQGRVKIWIEEIRDLDDNLVSKRKDKYVYYPTNEIDTITMEKYNDKDVLVGKEILKHFRDGSQPNLIIVDIEIPKGL